MAPLKLLSPNAFSSEGVKFLSSDKGLTPALDIKSLSKFKTFPNKPCSTSLLKTLWEKEKLLVMSNFSFTHNVFTPFDNFLPFLLNLKMSSTNSFSLEESEICCLRSVKARPTWKRLQMKNYR